MNVVDEIQFDSQGLVPAVVQDAATREVLMLGFMNRQALEYTLSQRRVAFWSRSRQTLWIKGETSGMALTPRALRINCENNSLLILADPTGPTCHTGHNTCYFREAEPDGWREIAPVVASPEELYGSVRKPSR